MFNSLLIEGTIEKVITREKGLTVFSLIVARKEYVSHFEVRSFGRLAENHNLKKGAELRICGSLRESNGDVFIVAEHFDFKKPKSFNYILDEL